VHEAEFVDRWRWLRKAETALEAVCADFAAERSLRLLLIFSFVVGTAYCAWLFDSGFLLGASPYWENPRGVVGNSWADMPATLSGYTFFQRDSWQLPLFHVTKLGAPAGVNIIFTDSIPWVALAGRLVFRATGAPVNLYGAWTAMCFVASGMTLTGLVATLGQRNLAAATMATVTSLTMPALLARWGHMSLMAQFEVSLALIFYLRNRNSSTARRMFSQGGALSLLALWTQAYLFVMVMGIVLATIAQAVTNRTLKWRDAVAVLFGVAALAAVAIALSGYLSPHGDLAAEGFGFYSMNMLSPVVPQRSGLAASLREYMLDATRGQYEGFSYLGGGVLLLFFATFFRQLNALRAGFMRNPWLLALLVGCTLFALSNVVYVGHWKILELPLSGRLADLASMFRSSGRLFWPVMYALTALAIAAAIPLYGRRGVLLILVATSLQWIDTAPLREAISERTRAPEKSRIDLAAWRTAIGRHRFVRVLPEYSCLAKPHSWNQEVAVEIELAAAFADRPVNSVYASRFEAGCAAEQAADPAAPPTDGELTVYLSEFAGINRIRALAAAGDACQSGPRLLVCSDIPGEASQLAGLTHTN
jgi:Family of unknown function (DUF6311)